MTRRKFGSEFKIEAVKLVTERGVSVAQAARDLDLAESVLRRWMRELAASSDDGLSWQWPTARRSGRDRSPEEGGRQAQGGA